MRVCFYRQYWVRRWWWWPGLVVAMGALVIALWLLSHLRPRPEVFAERRGPLVNATVESRPEGGFITDTVRATASTGLVVEFRVLRPVRPVGTRLPLVVILGGHRTGRNAVDILGDPGSIAVAALDYPYHGPERPRGVVQSLQSVPAIQRGILDTPPAVSVALDWLAAQPWVDPARMELMGVSLGVPFAAPAGALDTRFRRVWLVHGGVGNRAWIANRLERKIGNAFLRDRVAGLAHLLAYGSTFKTEEWTAQIAPRAVVVVGAEADEQLPRSAVEALHAAAGEPRELLWSQGGHVQPERTEIVRQLLGMVRTRIEGEGTAHPTAR